MPKRKFSSDDVEYMRYLFDKKGKSVAELSRIYNTTNNSINNIVRRKTYKEVGAGKDGWIKHQSSKRFGRAGNLKDML